MANASSYLGKCVSRIRRNPDGTIEHYDFHLRFNTSYDLPESVIEDTIIHEMIHYFILYNGLRDSSPHGQIFKAMMKSINTAYGRNLSISHRVTPEQRAAAKTVKKSWHVIAVISFRNGVTGFKVVPRVGAKIVDFYHRVSAVSGVRRIELFLHDDPFFNAYPVSFALSYHEIQESELRRYLEKAHRLTVSNGKIIQGKG